MTAKVPVARAVRMPTGAHAEGGKIIACPTLSYLSDRPVGVAEMTPTEALMLADSLIQAVLSIKRPRGTSVI